MLVPNKCLGNRCWWLVTVLLMLKQFSLHLSLYIVEQFWSLYIGENVYCILGKVSWKYCIIRFSWFSLLLFCNKFGIYINKYFSSSIDRCIQQCLHCKLFFIMNFSAFMPVKIILCKSLFYKVISIPKLYTMIYWNVTSIVNCHIMASFYTVAFCSTNRLFLKKMQVLLWH